MRLLEPVHTQGLKKHIDPLLSVLSRASGPTYQRGRIAALELALQQRDLAGERITFELQVTSLLHDATELPLMPLGKPPVLISVCRYPLDIDNELLVTPPDL